MFELRVFFVGFRTRRDIGALRGFYSVWGIKGCPILLEIPILCLRSLRARQKQLPEASMDQPFIPSLEKP